MPGTNTHPRQRLVPPATTSLRPRKRYRSTKRRRSSAGSGGVPFSSKPGKSAGSIQQQQHASVFRRIRRPLSTRSQTCRTGLPTTPLACTPFSALFTSFSAGREGKIGKAGEGSQHTAPRNGRPTLYRPARRCFSATRKDRKSDKDIGHSQLCSVGRAGTKRSPLRLTDAPEPVLDGQHLLL